MFVSSSFGIMCKNSCVHVFYGFFPIPVLPSKEVAVCITVYKELVRMWRCHLTYEFFYHLSYLYKEGMVGLILLSHFSHWLGFPSRAVLFRINFQCNSFIAISGSQIFSHL